MAEGRARDPDCLFCRIVAGEIPSDLVHDDDLVVAIRDIAPRAPTHVLFLSRAHI
ncbi:MAG: HIT domain-containing protein, partial [Chloroflexota bacterium]|nr:HIT domain-containing protein [Chloroflexota bacterium]